MLSRRTLGVACATLSFVGLLAFAPSCSDDAVNPTGAGGSTTSGTPGNAGSTTSGTPGNAGSTTSGSGPSTTDASSTSSGGTGGGPPAPLVRFVAIGDSGKGNQGQYDVAAAIAAKCAADGCDFVQMLGDNIYDSGVSGTNDPQWQEKFELPYANIDLPFWVVLGNHDYGGDGAGYEFDKGQHEIDYTNVSTKWMLPSAYWQRKVEHVLMVGLDTNMAMYNQADDQAGDVPGWLAQSTATWKIVFGHHPYLSNGPHGNAGEYDGLPFVPIANGAGVKDLLDDTVCGVADVYLCGHDHDMQWMQGTCGGTELIVSGAAAATTSLEGDNPVHFESEALGFLYVRIEGNTFTGQFIDTTGAVLYERTITK